MDLEVEKADLWGAGVAILGEFVATDAVRFSLGELDVSDKVGIRYFFSLGMVCLETKNMVLVLSMCLDGIWDLPPPCAKQKNSFAVEISQVAFSGPDRRVWREYLAPVVVLITAAAVATAVRG